MFCADLLQVHKIDLPVAYVQEQVRKQLSFQVAIKRLLRLLFYPVALLHGQKRYLYAFVLISGKCQNFLTRHLLIKLSRLPLTKYYHHHPGPPSLNIAKYTIKNSSCGKFAYTQDFTVRFQNPHLTPLPVYITLFSSSVDPPPVIT